MDYPHNVGLKNQTVTHTSILFPRCVLTENDLLLLCVKKNVNNPSLDTTYEANISFETLAANHGKALIWWHHFLLWAYIKDKTALIIMRRPSFLFSIELFVAHKAS